MKPIHPICAETCREHYGKPVLIILKDGGEVAGILTKLENGSIILNGDSTAATNNIKPAKKTAAVSKKGKNKAKVSFSPYPYPPVPYYPPFNPYGGALILDLALIALLFALF
ncbi:MAG: hypothetical protein K0S39_5921 [Paenibacillus sp.]|jgi:small nuclear ribonucleoprotein (snRNP)-like protein|nr:hypothetical protein [Paenibacillus sp.]